MDYRLREPPEAYQPQPGDLVLATDQNLLGKLGHWAAGSGAPQHSGIVVARPDGRLAVLEAGPHNSLHCTMSDWFETLHTYSLQERVWIRRRRMPLTPEQSCSLTAFAVMADGKPFAVFRVFRQVSGFRSRGPLRIRFMGSPHGERRAYFCAELVIEACVKAGLIDAATARPAATYPRDLFFAHSRNRFLDEHLDLTDWYPPARWTPCPGLEPVSVRRAPRLDGDGGGP
jgi:hypothetical protein